MLITPMNRDMITHEVKTMYTLKKMKVITGLGSFTSHLKPWKSPAMVWMMLGLSSPPSP
jgi:hypothetical protein